MNTFDFFFGLHLGVRLFSQTDNLSKTLQKTKMPAVSGQRVANLIKQDVVKKMRNNETVLQIILWRNSNQESKASFYLGTSLT